MTERYADQNELYYAQFYQFRGRSKWMEKIWSEAFGGEYPQGLDHYGYITRSDLRFMESHLEMGPGDHLLDIGCGKGGPGLWLAQQQQLRLTGMDYIPEAIVQANGLRHQFNLAYPAQFQIGNLYKIPFEDPSVDGVVCIDALWAVTDKIRALREIQRVMRPGSRLLFTYWDLKTQESVPLFEFSGLKYVTRRECPDWKAYQLAVYEGILKYEKELVAEMGDAANMLLYEAKASPPWLDLSERRIYVFEKTA